MLEHLKSRHLDPTLYSNLAITDETVTFPLWNLSGQMVGFQQYRPKGEKGFQRNPKMGRYFTVLQKNTNTAWGLDVLNPKDKTIYLLEGVFKACRFHNYGLNALGVLGNNPKHLRSWLNSLGYHLVSVCDGDEAGKKLAKFGDEAIFLDDGLYVDELSEFEFENFLYWMGSAV